MPLVVVAAGWLIRHELARRAAGDRASPRSLEPVVAEPALATVTEPVTGGGRKPVAAGAGTPEPVGREVPV